MNRVLAIGFALALAGCSIGPAVKEVPATYDLGAGNSGVTNIARIHSSVLLQNVAAPSWLETSAIIYRLNYQDPARQQVYTQSRWAATPAVLLTQRLRARLGTASDAGVVGLADGARADYMLRVELDDFSQVFDTPTASRAVASARASLVNAARRTVVAQKSFVVERQAASANAEGGVRALAAAGDDLIDAVTAWAATQLAADRK